jgi:hypothetical protein
MNATPAKRKNPIVEASQKKDPPSYHRPMSAAKKMAAKKTAEPRLSASGKRLGRPPKVKTKPVEERSPMGEPMSSVNAAVEAQAKEQQLKHLEDLVKQVEAEDRARPEFSPFAEHGKNLVRLGEAMQSTKTTLFDMSILAHEIGCQLKLVFVPIEENGDDKSQG